jgi:hypothetical protein
MPVLTKLCLSSCPGSTASIAMWAALAKIPAISTLEDLELIVFDFTLHDFTSFVLKHKTTLKKLVTSTIGLHGGTKLDLSTFYTELGKSLVLKDFHQYGLSLKSFRPANAVLFPRHLCIAAEEDDEDDDGFIEVYVCPYYLHWKGQDEVKRVLAEMAAFLWSQ